MNRFIIKKLNGITKIADKNTKKVYYQKDNRVYRVGYEDKSVSATKYKIDALFSNIDYEVVIEDIDKLSS